MNTTQKGNELEDLLYNILGESVNNDVYGKYTRLRKHKIYRTLPYDDNLDVDVSVDCYLNQDDYNDDKPFYSIIFECKNYKRQVDKGRLNEFCDKMTNFPGCKGCFVTTSGFSKPMIEYARKKGISLALISPEKKLNYIVKRSINDYRLYHKHLEELETGISNSPILIFDNNAFTSIDGFLHSAGIPVKNAFKAPHLKNDYIDKCVDELLTDLKETDDVISFLLCNSKDYRLSSELLDENMLGYLNIEEKIIYTNASLKPDDPRLKFTIAHELGHFYLHYNYLKNYFLVVGENDNSLDSGLNRNKEIETLERQANRFASHLLMPRAKFEKIVVALFCKYGVNRGRLYVDNQPCNLLNYHKITGELARIFGVSKKACALRMEELGLLQKASSFTF